VGSREMPEDWRLEFNLRFREWAQAQSTYMGQAPNTRVHVSA